MAQKRKVAKGKGFILMGLPFIVKLFIAVVLDFIDFTLGRIPGTGTIYDILVTGVTLSMVGPIGLLTGWEIIGDPTEQVDGFIPSASIIVVVAELI